MSIVGQIDDPTEHAAVHLAQREALNDALDLDLDLGVVSLLDDPATHLAVHSEDREALAGAGSSVSQADLGWRLGYAEGHVAAHLAEARARILFTMSVLLRATTAEEEDWTASDPWRNEGSAGSALDAAVGDITPILSDGKFTADDGTGEPGWWLHSGFEIPNNDLWNPTIGADALTIVHDWTPLDAPNAKGYWHYDGVDLTTAGSGFVSEELDYGPPYQFYVWSANDLGPENPATIGVPVSPAAFGTRRVDVARISGDTLSLFRDGAPVGTFDMTGRGPIASTALLKLGQPSDHYSFAAVDRALTDAEIAALDFAA